jgi:hypothetical protein
MIGRDRIIGAVLVAASVAAIGMSVAASYQTRRYAACQSAVSEALIRVQTARAEAAAQDRVADQEETAAVTALIDQVFTAKTAEQAAAAYKGFAEKTAVIAAQRAATERQRTDNPIPPLPSKTCAGGTA